MIKRFAEYNKVNENYINRVSVNVDVDDTNKDYYKQIINELDKHINIKEVIGEVGTAWMEFTIKLESGDTLDISFDYESRPMIDDEIMDYPETTIVINNGESIDFTGKYLEQVGISMGDNRGLKPFLELLRNKGIISTYSAVLNIDGYADYTKTFDSESEAKEFIEQWKDSWEVVKGHQMSTKRVGVTEEGSED